MTFPWMNTTLAKGRIEGELDMTPVILVWLSAIYRVQCVHLCPSKLFWQSLDHRRQKLCHLTQIKYSLKLEQ